MRKNMQSKYSVSSRVTFWSWATFVVLLAFYIVLQFVLSNVAISVSTDNNSYYYLNTLDIVSNVVIVLLSILGTTLLTANIIQVNEKNDNYTDIMLNDVFSSEEFHERLSKENKQKILHKLERTIYFNTNPILQEMYETIRYKLLKSNSDGFYYIYNNFDIDCSVFESYIEKTIVRTVAFRSYAPTLTVDSLKIVGIAYDKASSISKPLEIEYVKLNGSKENSQVKLIECSKTDCINKNYSTSEKWHLKEKIELRNDKNFELEVRYITRVPISDNKYICRVAYPCKELSATFTLLTPSYQLSHYAFGFIDDAKKSSGTTNDNKIKIELKDWIYPLDGLVVILNKKK